jgi:5-deoxy-glucuronate isomerase
MSSEILVRPSAQHASDGAFLTVTPASAGWSHVGFEALALAPGQVAERPLDGRECCVVVIAGHVHVRSRDGAWRDVGGRLDPFSGTPDAVYLPPGGRFAVEGAGDGAEVGLCFAPAPGGGVPARRIAAADVPAATRGYDRHERTVHDVLMVSDAAESLLVTEVITPSGNWSSYPPHKHDRDALPQECLLEETYYHRVTPADGFGIQRVYSDDRTLDETVAFSDRDLVLVPRGYHAVAAPPGVALYYLNVMAGPVRTWAFQDDPALAWTRADGATTDLPIPKEHGS